MTELIVPEGSPDVVNLSRSRHCRFCGSLIMKRKQMWKYPDGNYMCISCKTRLDEENAKEVTYSADFAATDKL
jgi:uncharacterized protein YlaI